MSETEKDAVGQMLHVARSIPLNFIIPEHIQTQHATNLIVQQKGTEFILYFFEVLQPLIGGTAEEQIDAYSKLESIDAVCISRTVVSIENLQEMLQNLIANLNQYQQMLNRGDQ